MNTYISVVLVGISYNYIASTLDSSILILPSDISYPRNIVFYI